ncbi:MAG: hypothetical protein EA349_03200 [Halomonadaceae bacterium]|nr:MAG: hypothetical protein EA349_03200 [Halomonadaceae bacterium]
MQDAITLAHAGILGEYDVPPTAVVLADGNNVQLVLGGLKDEQETDGWQDALRAIREELNAPAVLLYFSAWTTVQHDGQDESLDTLIVQIGTPGKLHFRAYEQMRDKRVGLVTELRELTHLREDTDPEAETPMQPNLGDVFAPIPASFRASTLYLDLMDSVTEKLDEKSHCAAEMRSQLH